jgi:hypothetical protein
MFADMLMSVVFTGMMLDARCWLFRIACIVNTNNIQNPETSIRDQPMPTMIFAATA